MLHRPIPEKTIKEDITMQTRKNAFTLIELLVVISIIALLVSILLPALSSARDQAKMAVCSVHINGIGKAVIIYASDAKDILPTQGISKKTGKPTVDYLDNQSFCNWHPYWGYDDYKIEDGAGPAELGCLYVTGLLDNMSNVVFCPSFRGFNLGSYNGNRRSMEYDSWNSKGDNTHWNYMGVNATYDPKHGLLPGDETKIGWLHNAVSYGVRPMFNLKIKNVSRMKNMSYLSDVWMAGPSSSALYRIHIDEVSHASKGSTEAKMHTWYIDGHVERRNFPREKYFVSFSTMSSLPPKDGGFMNWFPTLTWRVLFEDGIVDDAGLTNMVGRPYDFSQAK
jgi:prepilin-type N-terminal cleavage/methylation domain-containing protein